MNKYFGSIVLAMLLAMMLVPMGSSAPTRATEPVITGIMVDGLTAPGGEYATGSHAITAVIENEGDTYALPEMNFTIEIRYSGNGTVLLTEEANNKWVPLDPEQASEVLLGSFILPEGDFNITVSTTYESQVIQTWKEITVEDVVDLSLSVTNPTENAELSPGINVVPMVDVTFTGNMGSWLEDVSVMLVMTIGQTEIYNETVIVMDESSSAPRNPPYTFSNIIFPGWVAITGDVTLSFTLEPMDEYVEDNMVEFQISVEQRPSIEGIVTSTFDVPVPGVEVGLWLGLTFMDNQFTDSMGHYEFEGLAPANYTLKFTKTWAVPAERFAVVTLGGTVVVDVQMELLLQGSLEGMVYLPGDVPAQGAAVIATPLDGFSETAITDMDGKYMFPALEAGEYNVSASLSGYQDDWEITTVFAEVEDTLDLDLTLIDFTVDFIEPPNEELSFAVWEEITIVFSRPLNESTLSNIILTNLDADLPVDVSYELLDDGITVIMDPSEDLEYDTEYEVRIGTFLKDINGLFFPQVYISTFTTEAHLVEVTVTSVVPANNQANVPIGALVKVVFSHPMDGDTINLTTFRVVKDSTSISHLGSIQYNPANRTAILRPAGNLDYGTRYRIELSAEILPLDQDQYFEGDTFIFTTITQVTTGSVSGKVLDPDGNPYLSPDVQIKLVKGTSQLSKNPSPNGSFSFTDVAPGEWTLTVLVKGKEKHEQKIMVELGEVTNLPTINVKEDKDGIDYTILIIVLAVIVLVVIVVIIVLLMSRKAGEEVEDTGRFGRRYGGYGAGYGYEDIAGEFMCPECQTVVGPDETSCPGCGNEFEPDLFECPECGTVIPGDAPKCPECNAEFEYEPGEEEDYYPEDDEEREVDVSGEYEISPMDEEPEYRGRTED